jgi:hypothetical protein
MTLKKNKDEENLEEYAVDVGKLKEVHEELVAKTREIQELIAEEQQFGPLDAMTDSEYERLRSHVDQLLQEWEKEKNEDGRAVTGSVAFNRLAQERFAIEQQILDAEDEQVEEATEHPFEHPLR